MLQVCCGEVNALGDGIPVDRTSATIKSLHTGDASVEVTRVSMGTGERLGGTWYLTLDGEVTERITADASAEHVSAAIVNLTTAGNVSVTEGPEGEGPNGERSWVISFHDWNNPNRTFNNPILTLGAEDLIGTGPSGSLEYDGRTARTADNTQCIPGLCSKAVARVSSLLSVDDIDDCNVIATWQGSAGYSVPAFPANANASTVEKSLSTINETVLGQVWVTHEDTVDASPGAWNITFIGNTEGRIPELTCGSDAVVSWIVNASCPAIGGSFVLEFGDNTTEKIVYNASAFEVSTSMACAWLYRGSC